ncbi:hypothetical protein BDP27DRAFT_1333047 [Rhodocollybia butyracea]|uniref:Uncharacterized protein n=1 Tax=Rhodocollybia butyracea TaxID=206335 RepID=A0A9P5U3P7_9AGAR|nr:hypothetical protein BDP27DRAFT_1333047 [Rhodocollybia butyracea]
MQPNGDYEAIWRALPFDLSFLDDAGPTQWLLSGLPDMECSGIDCDDGFLDILMTAPNAAPNIGTCPVDPALTSEMNAGGLVNDVLMLGNNGICALDPALTVIDTGRVDNTTTSEACEGFLSAKDCNTIQKVRKWPGSWYTFEIKNGFIVMDTIRGGEGKRPQGNSKDYQFDAAFPGVSYKRSTVSKAYDTYRQHKQSALFQHYVDMGATVTATWAKFDRAAKV